MQNTIILWIGLFATLLSLYFVKRSHREHERSENAVELVQ
jgi:hypothetical protein